MHEAAGRHARAAEALEAAGELTAAATAWRRAHEASQPPSKTVPLTLPPDAAHRWTEGGRPARLLARTAAAARSHAARDARVRGLACAVAAAESAGRLDEAEALWTTLGDPHQALRCQVQRLERDGALGEAAALLERHGLFPAAGRAWRAAGDTAGVTRCEARRLQKKRRWQEAEALWLSIGAQAEAALCRAREMVLRGDYRAAADAFAQAGQPGIALELSVLAAQQEGDWDGAVAVATTGGRTDLIRRIRKAQQAAAAQPGPRQAASDERRGDGKEHSGRRPPRARNAAPARRSKSMRALSRSRHHRRAGARAAAASDIERLVATVRRHPGARSEDLARLSGIQGPRLAALLRAAVAAGHVVRSGATRGTRYWPRREG